MPFILLLPGSFPGAQDGRRFSRNAVSPSFASSEARRSAIVRTVNAIASAGVLPGHLPISRFATPTASGPAASSDAAFFAPAAFRSPAGTARCTSPMRSRLARVETVARQEEVPRRARPDRPKHERRDHRGQDPEPHLGEREDGSFRGDRDVGGGDEADASADRGAVRERDHGLAALVDRAEHPRHPFGVRFVLGLV